MPSLLEERALTRKFAHATRRRIFDRSSPYHRILSATHLRVFPGKSKFDERIFIIGNGRETSTKDVGYRAYGLDDSGHELRIL